MSEKSCGKPKAAELPVRSSRVAKCGHPNLK